MKRQETDWKKKYFQMIYLIKQLYPKYIFKKILHLNNRKGNNLIEKMGKILNRHFFKEHLQMDKTDERMFNIFTFGKCTLKLKYYFTSTRAVIHFVRGKMTKYW